MRTLLKLLFLAAVLWGLFTLRHSWGLRSVRLQSEMSVVSALSDITSSWDPAVFKSYQDNSINSLQVVSQAFASYRKLGKRTGPVTCDIQNYETYRYKENAGNYVAATYQCDAQFEKAPAVLQVIVVRYTDSMAWKISYFNLVSSYFVPQMPK